ncbi:hypothetical protein MHYP_G00149820 [Metynnis hypsauchen]
MLQRLDIDFYCLELWPAFPNPRPPISASASWTLTSTSRSGGQVWTHHTSSDKRAERQQCRCSTSSERQSQGNWQ